MRTREWEDAYWKYNARDTVYTYEIALAEREIVKQLKLEPVHSFQQKLFWPVLQTMQQGVRIDLAKRKELTAEVKAQILHRQEMLEFFLGHKLNPASSKQMHNLFYKDLQQKVVMTRAKKGVPARPTLDDEALQTISLREPLLKPIINCIADIRTLSIFLSTFLEKSLDIDNRMRCSYNIGGSSTGKSAPKTYRLSSSEDAFGSGGNLQNIPSEKSKSLGKAVARGNVAMLGDPYQFPNLRSMFIPDEGCTFFDGDLDRADLQVFVWEIGDEVFKTLLKRGVDIHLFHAYVLDNKEPPPLDELIETHPKYLDHRLPMKMKREFSKVFCHAVDYVGGERTISAAVGKTVHEVSKAKKTYLGAHPQIEPYWKDIEAQIRSRKYVENKFGYRWYIFDRLDNILPEAVAWVPQSTVSVVINKIWVNLYEQEKDVRVLLQVHDSLCGQFPTTLRQRCSEAILANSRIIIPYEDPLVIPFGLKTSEESWGACK